MWILGVSAVVGNAAVLLQRLKEKSSTRGAIKQSWFITSLAASDCIMGVYMLILASADIYYGDEYYIYSDQWRSGSVCRVASFLGLLSSEASVFFITLISVDRFLSLLFPFSRFQLGKISSKISISILWVFSLVLAIIPTLYAGPESDLYDLSDVCIGLPLITRPATFQIQSSNIGDQAFGDSFDVPIPKDSKPAWYFSIAIFLGINLLCFVVIFLCYICIFGYIRATHKQIKRSENQEEEIKIALKMAAIVGTDFICWFPVIVMGILSQTGLAVIPLEMYTWCVVFILPINSSLNPYLYTFASLISDYRKKAKQAENMSMTGMKSGKGGNTLVSVVTNQSVTQ